MIKFDIQTRGDARVRALYDSKIIEKAAARAINDAARGVRTEAGRAIRAKFNIKAKRLNKELKNVRMARPSTLTAEVRAKGRPIGLINFGAKWVRNVGGRSRTTTTKKSTVGKRKARSTGVSVMVRRGQRIMLHNAFIGHGRRGNVDGAGAMMVFKRIKTRSSSYIYNPSVITVASMIQQPHVAKVIRETAEDRWAKRFDHHMNRLLS